MTRIERVNIALTVIISLGFAALAVFVFSSSYLRLWETLVDLWSSIKYYFCELFNIEKDFAVSVNNLSDVFTWETWLPPSWEGFQDNAFAYLQRVFSKDNFLAYLGQIQVATIAKALVIAIPIVLVLVMLIRHIYRQENTRHNVDTRPLRIYKWIMARTFLPISRFARQYWQYVNRHSTILLVWILTWCLSLNLASIIVAFFAFYFYFAISIDFKCIYVQFGKLIIDLQVAVKNIPVIVWVILGLYLFHRFRVAIARRRLHHYEARNCGFINELPIVSMTCGSMGKKKTTVITDMALSQEVMFRQEAYSRLQQQDVKFPNFPWISFEMELRRCMEHRTVFNLATIKDWVRLKESRYLRHLNVNLQLYGYDACRYGYLYNDGLKVETLWDVLETYAQLYFIYVIESSLLVTNYAIRTDNRLVDHGNFPVWFSDFFPETVVTDSRHSHILDFDLLRLGRKIIEDNPANGGFEFGVLVITEIGKERGNNLELKETRKVTDETNQKNDLFNAYLKMCRHSATVDNFPFIKVFTDEQRPASWGADARDLCDVITVVSSGEKKLALPFYTIEDMLAEWLFNRVINLYYDFRFRRGDNTLLVHILKNVASWIWQRNIRVYNRYGYTVARIEKQRGTMDGKIAKKKYFLMDKKIYSRRFSTDCFSDYFNDKARNSRVGLQDYREYATERATVEELLWQNSYFINSLYR